MKQPRGTEGRWAKPPAVGDCTQGYRELWLAMLEILSFPQMWKASWGHPGELSSLTECWQFWVAWSHQQLFQAVSAECGSCRFLGKYSWAWGWGITQGCCGCLTTRAEDIKTGMLWTGCSVNCPWAHVTVNWAFRGLRWGVGLPKLLPLLLSFFHFTQVCKKEYYVPLMDQSLL